MFKKLLKYIILGIFIDQISKAAISFFMSLNTSINLIPNFFNFTFVKNTGAAFSMFMGYRWIFIIVSIMAIYLIYLFFIKDKDLKKYEIIVYALLISGIIGNMLDRLILGYVRDFLSFHIFGYDFAIFNMADSFIVVSIIILLFCSFGGEKCKSIL